MPLYDYKCSEHGYFEQQKSIAEGDTGDCPTCGLPSKKVILRAPRPLIEAMADAGCPGAFMTSGDRIEKRHRQSGQYHTETPSQARANEERYKDFVNSVTVTPKGD